MVEIVGRDEELGVLDAFLDRAGGSTAFVLEGEAGIGKSTLWLAAVEGARERGLRVLVARPAETERGFAHSALGDLLESALDEVLPALAPPRRRALEVALALEEDDAPVDPRTLAIAVRNALEALAANARVLVAIDDVQWLDASSSSALAFALRRIRDENLSVLFARRLGEAPAAGDLDYALAGQVERRRVGPLSVGATQRLVQSQLGTTFSRPTLLRVHEASGGNPFYALELARALTKHEGGADPTRPLPVPDTLEGLVRARLEGLPDATRDALVLAAAHGRASPEVLRAAGVREGALDPARDARVVEVNGTIRFTHPLLASVLYQGLPEAERRAAHRRLADVVADSIGRARHLALATDRPDAEIALALDDAARHASARGAMVAAAELREHALRLTPPAAAADRHRRAIAAAEAHLAAGETERANRFATELEAASVEGPEHAEVLVLLAAIRHADLHEAIALLRRALREASDQPELRTRILQRLGLYVRFSDGIEPAEEYARTAVEVAEGLDDDAMVAGALASLALIRFNSGQSDAPELAQRAYDLAVASGDDKPLIIASFCLVHVFVWSWQLERARAILERLQREWAGRDEALAQQVWWYLSVLELRAGRWSLAEQQAERARELNALYARDDIEDPATFMPLALSAAYRGDLERARKVAEYAWGLADRQSALLPGLEAVVGVVELWSGNAEAAVERFASADETAATAGWVEPGIHWWGEEHVEALVELGRLDDAKRVLDVLEREATRLERGWALAQAARCRGLVAANEGDVERAAELLAEAVERHEAAGDRFGRGRALLTLGVVRRRQRQKRAARDAIEAALAEFEALEAPRWAEKARAELGTISGRRRDEGLTPAETRVAALVAEGRTNREVAAALFLGERTVESHLTRVYEKLGVRSRTELASKFEGFS